MADQEAVTRIFWDTFVLGKPIPFHIANRPIYERLALSWYFDNPGSSRVLWREGTAIGYVLVCTDQPVFERWQIREGWRYLRDLIGRSRLSSMTPLERRFFLKRIADGFEAWREEDPMGTGAHAHFNVAAGHRSGLAVKTLAEHVDEACREVGLTRWTGQMNAREGRRETVLAGYGFVIHSKTPNRTLSWLAGSEVFRLTVAREVGPLQRAPARSGS